LRGRLSSHRRLLLMNDEAHHVWEPDSAWNEAIAWLHETCRKRGGEGLVGQLDFSATPKDNQANYFKHIVCDTPLGEAVDAGIVKTPIIGRAGKLVEQATDNAAWKYEMHLKLGRRRDFLLRTGARVHLQGEGHAPGAGAAIADVLRAGPVWPGALGF